MGLQAYAKSTPEQLNDTATQVFDALQILRKEHRIQLNRNDQHLYTLLGSESLSLEDLLLLEPKYAKHLHDFSLRSIVESAFVLASPELKEWFLHPVPKKREYFLSRWNQDVHPLGEIIDAHVALLRWMIAAEEFPFPIERPLLINIKIVQTLLLECMQNSSPEDLHLLYEDSLVFWKGMAFCSPKSMQKIILALRLDNPEEAYNRFLYHHKMQRLYANGSSSTYAKSSLLLLEELNQKIASKTISYNSFNLSLYLHPPHTYPPEIVQILLRESSDVVSLFSILDDIQQYRTVGSSYERKLHEIGSSHMENRRYHQAKTYLFVRSLMNRDIIQQSQFDSLLSPSDSEETEA